MPETPGGCSGKIEWESDWSSGEPPSGPEPAAEPLAEDRPEADFRPDTPELTFEAVHAAFPGTLGPLNAAGDAEIDYSQAWLSEAEIQALGAVAGLRVLNPMAGTGEDAIVLARLGAGVTATNLGEGGAREYARNEGLDIDFTQVHQQVLPESLRSGDFDLVYVGPDSLPWIEDLDGWAWGLADALAPGGRLVIHDEHPLTYVFTSLDGKLVVNTSYFGEELRSPDALEDEEPLSLTREEGSDPEAPDRTNFGWTLGDLVSAFGDHGVATIHLEEMASSERFFTALDSLPDVYEDELDRVPGAFILVGIKMPSVEDGGEQA